jgi:hypothetical protein
MEERRLSNQNIKINHKVKNMLENNKQIRTFEEKVTSLLFNNSEFLKGVNEEIKPQFEGTTDLRTFLKTTGKLKLEDMRLIVDQALLLLEMFYVHLPLKRAMHAIDPVQRLRLLKSLSEK